MNFLNGFINSGLKGLVKGLAWGLAVSLAALGVAAITAGAAHGTAAYGMYSIAISVLAPTATGFALSGAFIGAAAVVYGAIDGMIGGVKAVRNAEIRDAYTARAAARGLGIAAERAPQMALAEDVALEQEVPAKPAKKPEWLGAAMAGKEQASFADRAKASMLYDGSKAIH